MLMNAIIYAKFVKDSLLSCICSMVYHLFSHCRRPVIVLRRNHTMSGEQHLIEVTCRYQVPLIKALRALLQVFRDHFCEEECSDTT